MMNIRDLILRKLEEKGEVRSSEIVKATGYSRAYVNRYFKELREEGVLLQIGKANKAKYITATEKIILKERKSINKIHRILNNVNLHEDEVFNSIKENSGIIGGLSSNVSSIIEYAFTEMLNNAIEHSESKKIEIIIEKRINNIIFEVRDRGVGIFSNIMTKKGLSSEMDAIQDLLKGKQTTAPSYHSGEGIFFTSKIGDILTIQSSQKKLIFDNLIGDIFVRDVKNTQGTRILFSVSLDSTKDINGVFRRYSDNNYEFSKTEVAIKLYAVGVNYISRSQARRVLTGLENFKAIMLDFREIDTIGQSFADEIFRVWKMKNPKVNITFKNTNENVLFMIKRAISEE
jgi:anti-sigma regulatory factor (Ser/Thr protein kinase)/biotin operon repressor